MPRKLIHSNSGKIGITYTRIYRTGIDYFTKWYTLKEYRKLYKLYNYRDSTYLILNWTTIVNTTKDLLKERLAYTFNTVFKHIKLKWNPHWISVRSKVERTCIYKIVQGLHTPNLYNTINLILFIYEYIPNFCLWFLFGTGAPMTKPDIKKPNIKHMEKDEFKEIFRTQLKKAFDKTNEDWTYHWISNQAKVKKTSLIKIIKGETLPDLTSFLRIVMFINEHNLYFNFWYLFSLDENLTIDDDKEKEYFEEYFE